MTALDACRRFESHMIDMGLGCFERSSPSSVISIDLLVGQRVSVARGRKIPLGTAGVVVAAGHHQRFGFWARLRADVGGEITIGAANLDLEVAR
jgi:hypothetical protein